MNATAGDAGEATGRGMAIRNDSVDARRENLPQQYGVVVYTFEWTNFGAVDGDRLTGTEPFASGFEPDRTFTVAAPDGYAVTSATPEPSSSGATTASWSAGTSLEGFELVAAPSAGSGDGATDGVGAGFGAGVAATALVGAALLARRRP